MPKIIRWHAQKGTFNEYPHISSPNRRLANTLAIRDRGNRVMPRNKGDQCNFRQRDVMAVIKAARRAGLENFRVDVTDTGTISVTTTAPDQKPAEEKDSWSDYLQD